MNVIFFLKGGGLPRAQGGQFFDFFLIFFLGPLLAAYQIANEKTTLEFCEAIGKL